MPLPIIAAALLPLIAEAAPRLVQMVTGSERAGSIADAVTGVVGAATGIPIRTAADAERAMEAVRADPETLSRVKAEIRAVEAQEMEALLADRQDARARDVALRSDGGSNRRADVLIFGLFGLLVGTVAAMLFVPDIPPEAMGLLGALGGGLAKSIYDVVAFEFGSSRGSKEKDASISRAFSVLPPNPPATPPRGTMEPVVEPGDRPQGRLLR